jgi:hypothetical protein
MKKKRRMNKKVKERLSQLSLSPQTLKNKPRQLARNLESKLIAKCAQQKTLERPSKKKQQQTQNVVELIVKVLVVAKVVVMMRLKQKERVEEAAVELKVSVVVELNLAVKINRFLFTFL